MSTHALHGSLFVSAAGDILYMLSAANSQVNPTRKDERHGSAGQLWSSSSLQAESGAIGTFPDLTRTSVARPAHWAGTLPGIMAEKRPPR